jgi:hypothetical protein
VLTVNPLVMGSDSSVITRGINERTSSFSVRARTLVLATYNGSRSDLFDDVRRRLTCATFSEQHNFLIISILLIFTFKNAQTVIKNVKKLTICYQFKFHKGVNYLFISIFSFNPIKIVV